MCCECSCNPVMPGPGYAPEGVRMFVVVECREILGELLLGTIGADRRADLVYVEVFVLSGSDLSSWDWPERVGERRRRSASASRASIRPCCCHLSASAPTSVQPRIGSARGDPRRGRASTRSPRPPQGLTAAGDTDLVLEPHWLLRWAAGQARCPAAQTQAQTQAQAHWRYSDDASVEPKLNVMCSRLFVRHHTRTHASPSSPTSQAPLHLQCCGCSSAGRARASCC